MSDWTFPPPPPPAPPAAPVAPPPEVVDDVAGLAWRQVIDAHVGDLVKVTYFDTAAQEDVVRYGTVVVVEGEAVGVAFYNEVSDPIPLDPNVHQRVDAPRVEVVVHFGD